MKILVGSLLLLGAAWLGPSCRTTGEVRPQTEIDGEWPVELRDGTDVIVRHPPQVESLQGTS